MPDSENYREDAVELDSSEVDEFMATARRRYEQSADDERDLRQEASINLQFVAGDQWDEKLKNDRTKANRPALTFNRCHTFVQSVSNEGRQNKPEIKFVPGESGDPDTAEIYEGLARHIQYHPDAQIAYETALEGSAGGGFGYFRMLTDYCDNESFDQEIKVVPVYDPFSVYGILVPSIFGLEPKFAFVVTELPKDEYEAEYGEPAVGWEVAERDGGGWIGTETVRIAEYWYVEESTKTIKKGGKSRDVTVPTVKCAKINGVEVLEEYEWAGSTIPIIPVLGKQMVIKGKPRLFSVVSHQRDAQKLINFYKTRIAETLGTSPISPYVGAEGQFEGHEAEWSGINSNLTAYVQYKTVDAAGKPIPPPQRQVAEPPIQAYSAAAAQEIDDMKATTGIFDPSLGNNSNETSGKAIFARQQQANVTNLHFMDNLERAFKKGGAVIAEMIPKIYDSPGRIIRILGPDEAPRLVKINQQHQDQNGRIRHFKIGGPDTPKYDVVITMGRSFATKRMESFDTMTQVLTANPNLLPMIGDIYFKNSDMAGADQLAERFKKMLPPNLQDQNADDPKAQVASLQAQLAQLQQQHQVAVLAATKLMQEKEAKVAETQGKAAIAQMQEASKQEIVKMQEATKLAVAQINASKDANQAFAEREMEQYRIMHESAHDVAMQKDQHAHEAAQAEKQAEIASAQSAQDAAQNQQAQQDNGGE